MVIAMEHGEVGLDVWGVSAMEEFERLELEWIFRDAKSGKDGGPARGTVDEEEPRVVKWSLCFAAVDDRL